MDISVVVPFYNVAPYIEACIDALLSQEFPAARYEVIMVDNNSTDASPGIVRRYSRVTCLEESRQGSYAARNRGLSRASGKIVAFTDSDCAARKDWLKAIFAAMENPGVGIVLGDRAFATDSGLLSAIAAYDCEMADRTFSAKRTEAYYGYTNNMAVRRELFDHLGPFAEIARGADNLFVRRAARTYGAAIVRYTPTVCVRHLEIGGVAAYLHKKYIYGSVNRTTRSLGSPRPLTLRERFGLFRRAASRTGSRLGARIALFGVLAAGAGCFAAGHWGVALKEHWRGGRGDGISNGSGV